MILSEIIVPTYVQMLGALSAWLGKAEQQHEQAETLLGARLAPDMFPLSTQIRFACVQAQEGMYRLRGEELSPLIAQLLEEGRNAGDHPGSIAGAQARIAETIAIVEFLATDAPLVDPAAPIAHALPQGMIFDLTMGQYVRDWTLPQFYFHIMTAYAILRAQGVELGKVDYVAHMFPYLRTETPPSQ
ncbi:DUF1993 domain-containing protein [Sphingobium sp. H39-3-25]|uniref:DUF1993 domain-containing protein n=1 Tax=Sphingobium arseniciresistens TaxID=3030834 RepID=UPI0023BA2F51|nr:DUF1993 domain-containing protein [Sphingobium arseniciresistens]